MMCSDDWEPYECKIDRKISSSDHYPIVCYLKSGINSKKPQIILIKEKNDYFARHYVDNKEIR